MKLLVTEHNTIKVQLLHFLQWKSLFTFEFVNTYESHNRETGIPTELIIS